MKLLETRWLRLLASVFAVALFAAACGSDDGESTAAEDSDEAAESDDGAGEESDDGGDDDGSSDGGEATGDVISEECSIPNPEDTVEIDIIGWQFPVIDAYVEEIEECEEGNYDINMQFLGSTDAQERTLEDIATGNPSFEIYQGSNSALVQYANANGLLPLNDLIDKYGDQYALDEIDQAFWDLVTIDGNIYAIPMVSNTMHVFYNKPKMEELGLEVPTTFEEAIALCEPLQEAGEEGFVLMYQAPWAWQIEFDNVLGSLGETNIDPETGQPNFTSDAAVEAATILKDVYDNCADKDSPEFGTTEIAGGFQSGSYIVGQTWASRAIEMDDENVSAEVGNIEFAPALSTGGDILAAPAYIDGYAIPADTDADVEAIFLAIMAAADRESQEAAAEFNTVTRNGVSNPDGPRNTEVVATSYIDGKGADLTHPAAGLARTILGDALQKIATEGADPATVLAEAEEQYLTEAEEQGLL